MDKSNQKENNFKKGASKRFIEVLDKLISIHNDYNTHAQISDTIGISKQMVSNIKNNQKFVSLQTLYKLKEKFNIVNLNYIISNEGDIFLGEYTKLKQKDKEIEMLQDEVNRLKIEIYDIRKASENS